MTIEHDDDDSSSIDLHAVFAGQEQVLRAELQTGTHAGHPGVQGEGTEDHWITLLSDRLPRRYSITKAIVVDSRGARSHQLDAVIYDRQYSPQFWEYGEHRYVPAEAVYAVFEIKPEMNREYIVYAGKKIASVRKLFRTSGSFKWIKGTEESVEHFRPLGGLLCNGTSWKEPFAQPFRDALSAVPPDGQLDLGCVLGDGSFEIADVAQPDVVTVSEPTVALVSFLLALLRRLQGLGTAPPLDHAEYARWITST